MVSDEETPVRSVQRALELLSAIAQGEELSLAKLASATALAPSSGERQRAAIARALAVEPQLVILDEAVSALDVSIQAQILNRLSELRQQTDVSYMLLTHDLPVVRQVADDVIVMRDGEVVERGSTDALFEDLQYPYTQLLLSCVPPHGWKPRRTREAAGAGEG